MSEIRDHDHWIFLVWLLFTGLLTFGFTVCWNEGLISLLVESDRSRICLAIGLLYLLGSAHCATRALRLAKESDQIRLLAAAIGNGVASVHATSSDDVRIDNVEIKPTGMLAEHLAAFAMRSKGEQEPRSDNEASTLVGMLVSRAKGSHDLGWFLSDVLLKLGLLGTIVGFILMLGSVADTASLDVNTMQKVLKQMSNGMGTALYTTLAGLVGSMALGAQYLLLDKGADHLIETILRVTESHLRAA